MGCVSICSEITEHAATEINCVKEGGSGNESVDISNKSNGCPLTATAVTYQERQNIYVPALIIKVINYLPNQDVRFVPSSVPDSNINQNSPPQHSIPIYLQLRNFRI
jgi:hypothetical protein